MDKYKTTKYFGWIFNNLLSLVFVHHPLKFRCSISLVSYHFTVLVVLYCSKSPMSTFWFESFFYLLGPVSLIRFKWFKRWTNRRFIVFIWRANRFDSFWSHFFSRTVILFKFTTNRINLHMGSMNRFIWASNQSS